MNQQETTSTLELDLKLNILDSSLSTESPSVEVVFHIYFTMYKGSNIYTRRLGKILTTFLKERN